jgi:hypothetical protein
MKVTKSFITLGICCLLIGCNQPQQKQGTTTDNDDIIWNASLSYCLTNDKPDWSSLRDDGSVVDYGDMYNFKINEKKGKYRDLIRLFYDSAISKTYPIYSVDPANGLFPGILNTAKEKQMLLTDSVWNNDHTKLLSSVLAFSKFIGLNINHEWLYDSKNGELKSTITDVDLLIKYTNSEEYLLNLGALKFSNRTVDSMGTGQPGLKSEITWGRDILMAIIDSGYDIKLNVPERWAKRDSLSRYSVNGISSTSQPKFPICIKTTFNKTLAEWIWLAARKGQLPAYYCSGKDSIGNQIPAKNMKDFGSVVDTICDESGNIKPVKYEITADNLSGVELKEDIAFHKNTFSFKSKIPYAAVLIQDISKNTGKPIHHTSTVLYWVKLN